MRALLGSTGFVGSNLLRQTTFDQRFHSTDIDKIRGETFSEVVCAAAPAAKWKANANPAADLANIRRLLDALETVRAGRFILISTVDVYPDPSGVDETTEIDELSSSPYGAHRRMLEKFVASRFNSSIIRLPALFGPGLKKNAIYDLLNDNDVQKIDRRGMFQFYDLGHLWSDIEVAVSNQLQLVNFATEPVAVSEIASRFCGVQLTGEGKGEPPSYDFRSIHASVFGGSGGYLYRAPQVMKDLGSFIAEERRNSGGVR